jgi:hypothetical protein
MISRSGFPFQGYQHGLDLCIHLHIKGVDICSTIWTSIPPSGRGCSVYDLQGAKDLKGKFLKRASRSATNLRIEYIDNDMS